MTADSTSFPGSPPPPPAVGAFVDGRPDGPRQVVRADPLYTAYHELRADADPDREAYLTVFRYPPAGYCRHFAAAGYSPRGYAGPAGCRALLLDIDRAGDLPAALSDARTLLRFLFDRYGPKLDDGVGVYFSGAKGFHLTVELLPALAPTPDVPAVCRRLAAGIATATGVRVDLGCYDHQRLVRLPNTRHPRTGLHKRSLTHEEVLTLDAPRLADLARHPAGTPVPSSGEFVQELQDDWDRAAIPPGHGPAPVASHPAVPKFVRDFIAWHDVQDPGRAVTLFRCAAALAEAGTPAVVVSGLLEEPALKSGLDPAEVRRQIATGVAYANRQRGTP